MSSEGDLTGLVQLVKDLCKRRNTVIIELTKISYGDLDNPKQLFMLYSKVLITMKDITNQVAPAILAHRESICNETEIVYKNTGDRLGLHDKILICAMHATTLMLKIMSDEKIRKDLDKVLDSVISIVLDSITLACRLYPSIEVIMRRHKFLQKCNNLTYDLMNESIELIRDSTYLGDYDPTREYEWLLHLFLLCDIDNEKMEILLDLVLRWCITPKGSLFIVSYILNDNYTLSNNRAKKLINSMINMSLQYSENIVHKDNVIYNTRMQTAIRIYIILLKLINKYTYVVSEPKQDSILGLERAIITDLICDYVAGKNKLAYKVYKQLSLLTPDTLTRQKASMMHIIGEILYAPGGEGYLEARNEFVSAATCDTL
jgi:hypothetical protein